MSTSDRRDDPSFRARGGAGVAAVVIDIDSGKRRSAPWLVTAGYEGRDAEGPRVIKRNGSWYLIVAEGGTETEHMVAVLTHRSKQHRFRSIGHADLVDAPDGSWWAVCLDTRPTGYPGVHVLGRETFLAPGGFVDVATFSYRGLETETDAMGTAFMPVARPFGWTTTEERS